MAKILTDRQEIRAWVLTRGGAPMLEELPDGSGTQALLQLTFGQHALNADHNEGPDLPGGFSLVDWDDWFAALEQQNLALKVNDEVPGALDNGFEFVARSGDGETTEAAMQPPAGSVDRPGQDEGR